MDPVKLAVFDCDGTLVDGQASICTAMERAFASLGLPPPDRALVRRIVGLNLQPAISQLLPDRDEALHAAATAAYKAAFRGARESGELSEPLFPGIAALLDRLRGAGWLLAVATGKSERGLHHCLEINGLSGMFYTLQTADHHPGKPNPAMLEAALAEAMAQPEQAVMIGDTVYDMAMARAAGVRGLGVAWGYHEPGELSQAGAEAVAQTPEDLAKWLI
ncbi:MAG: HAD-IA family hydrolase [Pseudomonadota bacterium]|nr:HAD-IA family hydrolase [Pseudomonadota bacterium]